jgi:hypothetical protein
MEWLGLLLLLGISVAAAGVVRYLKHIQDTADRRYSADQSGTD